MFKCQLILLLVDVLLSIPITAPRPKLELCEQTVYGTWNYHYNSYENGTIIFKKDGTYLSTHQSGDSYTHTGIWYLNGKTLYLYERPLRRYEVWEHPIRSTKYELELELINLPNELATSVCVGQYTTSKHYFKFSNRRVLNIDD